MNQMQRRVTGFSRNTQRSLGGVSQGFRTLRRVAGVALAAMTTGAVAKAVTDFASAGDEVAKMSRELGIGAEALQELRFAADRQGVASADLEKSLGALNNRVGQLRQNQGSLATMLNRSNPALAEQLKNAGDTDEAFTIMMEALNGTENAADRAALAQAAFGRSGQALVRMAEAGSAGIEDLREEARRLGLVMSEEATANAELFQDSLTNLKGAIRGVTNGALVPMIEKLQPLIQQMSDWIAANQELIQQRIERVFKDIADAGRTIARLWDNGVIPAVLAGTVAFKSMVTAVTSLIAVLKIAGISTKVFSATMMGIPVFGWIIAAITAVIAVTVLLIKNWDKVTEVAQNVWGGIVEYVQGVWDFFRQFFSWLGEVFAPIGDAIRDRFVQAFENIRAVAQAMWDFVSPIFDTISNVIDKVGGFLNSREGRNAEEGRQANAERYGMTTRNTAGLQSSRSESISRSEVDIRLGNLPRGSSVTQRGRAPGVSLAFGAEGGRL